MSKKIHSLRSQWCLYHSCTYNGARNIHTKTVTLNLTWLVFTFPVLFISLTFCPTIFNHRLIEGTHKKKNEWVTLLFGLWWTVYHSHMSFMVDWLWIPSLLCDRHVVFTILYSLSTICLCSALVTMTFCRCIIFFWKIFTLSIQVSGALHCRAVQRSWFARVNALCNLLCKKSRKVVTATSRLIFE